MAKIDDIIRDMELLLSSSDQSNSPRGRQLADTYAEICRDVNDSLAECRSLFRMGAYAEARKLNMRAVPMLTERYRLLNFSRRGEWIRLCDLYSWRVPPELDRDTVELLLHEDEQGIEVSITELQDQWRRIIRDGSLREKLILARKIYALEPSNVWRSNLLNVERPWVNLLKKEAEEAFAAGKAKELFEIYNELVSPDLLQKVSMDSLAKYQDMITTYSREQLEKKKQDLLNEIGSLYAAMLLNELEDALSRWSALESNPLFSCTRDEKIQIDDARSFLLDQQAEVNKNMLFNSLQNQLEQMLNESADPKEIDSVYRSLQQLDRPVKPLLEERMYDLYSKVELESKRRHVRRCIYWGFSVVLLAVVVFTVIFLYQRERDFRRDSDKIRDFIDERQYEAALEYCTRIAQERPYVARRPAIEALRRETEEKLEELQMAEQIFNQLCDDLEKKYLTDENVLDPVVPQLFQELEARVAALREKDDARKIALQQKYEELKKHVLEKRALEFLREMSKNENVWADFFRQFDDYSDEAAEQKHVALKAGSMALLNTHQAKISKELYAEWTKKIEGHTSRFHDVMKLRRDARALLRSISYPSSLNEYVDALGKAEVNSDKLKASLAQAIDQFPNARNLNIIYGQSSDLKKVADQYPQDPYCRDVNTRLKHPDHDRLHIKDLENKLNDLRTKTLPLHYNCTELVFYHKDVPCHFYLKDAPASIYLESNWRGNICRAVRLTFVVANNGLKANAVFRMEDYVQKNASGAEVDVMFVNGKRIFYPVKTQQVTETAARASRPVKLYFVPGQKFDQLPEELTLPDRSLLKDPGSLKTAPQYAVLQRQLARLTRRPDSCRILCAISEVAQERTITNVYAKVHLLKQLYAMLPIDDLPLYQKHLNGLKALLDSYSADRDRECWQDPTATFKYPQEVLTFRKKLDALDLKEQISTLLLSEILLDHARKHYPVAAGVLFRMEDGRWRLQPFAAFQDDLLQRAEAFILSGPAEQQQCVAFAPARFIAGVPENELPDGMQNTVFNGQLVYLNKELTSWKKVFQGATHDLRSRGFELPVKEENIVWPEIWPVNKRNVRELLSE